MTSARRENVGRIAVVAVVVGVPTFVLASRQAGVRASVEVAQGCLNLSIGALAVIVAGLTIFMTGIEREALRARPVLTTYAYAAFHQGFMWASYLSVATVTYTATAKDLSQWSEVLEALFFATVTAAAAGLLSMLLRLTGLLREIGEGSLRS